MVKVLTFGVFDYFHYGHLRLLERAKTYGDYLIVAVQEDDEIYKTKPNTKVLYDLDKRMAMIRALRCVDETISYKQVVDDVKLINFDVLVVGGDQNHRGILQAIEWCSRNNKRVVYLDRTPGISSSAIKSTLKNLP